jgi:hypothetical protein
VTDTAHSFQQHPKPLTQSEADRRVHLFALGLGDLATFCGLLQVVDGDKRAGQRVPMELTGIQRAWVHDRSDFDIVLKPRKVYITTVCCAEDLRFFLTRPGASVGVVVQSAEGDGPALMVEQIIDVMIASLRSFVPHVTDLSQIRKTAGRWTWPERDAAITIIQAGASKRVASKAGRASRYNRLHFTEVSSYEQGSESFAALIGTMPPTGVQVVLESTPKGSSGFFFDMWRAATAGKPPYRPHFYPWFVHDGYRLSLEPGEVIEPTGQLAEIEVRLIEQGVPPEALKWYRHQLGVLNGDLARLQQEYPNDPESCFLGSGDQYVPSALIEQCASYDPVPEFEGWTYAGIDFGRKNDLTVIVTLKKDMHGHLWVVSIQTCKRTDWETQMTTIFVSHANWAWRRVAVDATGMGSMPAELLENGLGKGRVEQVTFGEQTKEHLATTLYAAIAERRVTIGDHPELVTDVRQIRRIVADSGRVSYDAPRTEQGHADRAWALALAIQAAGIEPPREARKETGYGDYARGNS